MNPYALPRASSRRVRPLAVRSHFNQPASRVRLGVKPFRTDYARLALAVVVGFQLVMLIASAVLS